MSKEAESRSDDADDRFESQGTLNVETFDYFSIMRAVTITARKKYLKKYIRRLVDVRKYGQYEKRDEFGNPNIFMCSACLQRFFSYEELKEHVTRPTVHLIFRCQICFSTFEALNLCQPAFHGPDYHVNEVGCFPKKIPIELIEASPVGEAITLNEVCPECRKGVGSLIAHLWSSKPEDATLHCPSCNSFITRNVCRFNLHVRVHKNITPFRCPDCAKLFKNCVELHIHLNESCRHWEQCTRFKCCICGLVFHTNESLQNHTFSDHNAVKYKCHLCTAEFNITSEKNAHYDECHLEELTTSALRRSKAYIISHTCAICGEKDLKGFSYERHVRKHLTAHNSSFAMFICKCGFITMFKGTYLKHRSLPCLTLEFAALNDTSARLQMCTHCADLKFFNGSDPFVCEVCETCDESGELPAYRCSLCFKYLKYSMETAIIHLQIVHDMVEVEVPYNYVEKVPNGSNNIAIEEHQKEEEETKMFKEESKENILRNIKDETKESVARIIKQIVKDVDCGMEEPMKFKCCPKKEESKEEVAFPVNAEPMEFICSTAGKTSEITAADYPHKCTKCPATFGIMDELRSHYVSSHRENPGDFHCLECGEAFRSVKSLSIHLQSHGISDAVSYVNKYDVSSELHPPNYSVRVESGSDELLCPVCKLTFNKPAEHHQHMRSHGMAFLKRIKLR